MAETDRSRLASPIVYSRSIGSWEYIYMKVSLLLLDRIVTLKVGRKNSSSDTCGNYRAATCAASSLVTETLQGRKSFAPTREFLPRGEIRLPRILPRIFFIPLPTHKIRRCNQVFIRESKPSRRWTIHGGWLSDAARLNIYENDDLFSAVVMC